ncbi:MAG: hypothetical protein WCY01_02760 [Alkalispirochaeta sp.]|jgi:hypothetical protein
MSDDEPLIIRPEERAELYILLASREHLLHPELDGLKQRLESDLYKRHSIEEMENLIRRVHDDQR